MSKILIALGGNALGNTPSEQKEAVKITAKTIVKLFIQGNQIIIVHGNGPQVGVINNVFAEGFKNKIISETFPFAECGAMSQGYIGFHIQNAIINELKKQNITNDVVSIITQTIVNKHDNSFKDPSKPIGNFMEKTIAKKLAIKNNWVVKEDAGRGWRRVVASPKPIDIIEKNIISNLIKNKTIVIAGGGGGIPVIKSKDNLLGIDAVIDKDATASLLAKIIKVDSLIILTAVNQVKINFGKKNEESLAVVNLKELKQHIKDKQFAPGSMLPKIEAVIKFVNDTKNSAFIGELKDADKIIKGQAGTKINY